MTLKEKTADELLTACFPQALAGSSLTGFAVTDVKKLMLVMWDAALDWAATHVTPVADYPYEDVVNLNSILDGKTITIDASTD